VILAPDRPGSEAPDKPPASVVALAGAPCLCSGSDQGPISMIDRDGAQETIVDFSRAMGGETFGAVLVDPPWRFANRTGKVAPEHRRLNRYATMTTPEICALPVAAVLQPMAHLYLWTPNALLPDALKVMEAWGFTYKSNIVWHKIRKDGGSDGRGVGFYFRNVTEILLFGTRGKNARTREAGRRQVNYLSSRKREHSRKPDEQYDLIEQCSHGPYLEMFSRGTRPGWRYWGNQATDTYEPTWQTYSHNSKTDRPNLILDIEAAE